MDNSEFNEYLVFDENGVVLGMKKDAPEELKAKYRIEYVNNQDLERFINLFTSTE